MAKVLDSSAALALLRGERGSDVVFSALDDSIMSSVNVAEVLRVLVRNGASVRDAKRVFARLHIGITPFDYDYAVEVAEIALLAPDLSLGDCACLALGRISSAEQVVTADRVWRARDFGVPVVRIR
jgi:ribonuclease VapC